jgi:hypothetical protein
MEKFHRPCIGSIAVLCRKGREGSGVPRAPRCLDLSAVMTALVSISAPLDVLINIAPCTHGQVIETDASADQHGIAPCMFHTHE